MTDAARWPRGWPLRLALPLAIVGLGLLAWSVWPDRRGPEDGGVDGAALFALLADATVAAPGAPTGPLAFPADHGAHPDQPVEVWDLTGSFTDRTGAGWGLRLTLLRVALATGARASSLAAEGVIAGRLELLPPDGAAPLRGARASRTAQGLAGADATALWVDDWRLARGADGAWRLQAGLPGLGLVLTLVPVKAPLGLSELAGTGGESASGGLDGYLEPRLTLTGDVTGPGLPGPVTGSALLEHGWGAAPGDGRRGQMAVNRFTLQLDDGRELACLHLRRRAGGGTPVPRCLLIDADGSRRLLQRRDLTLAPAGRPWRDPATGTMYPLRWKLAAPAFGLALSMAPLGQGQSPPLAADLWSAPVRVTGSQAGLGRMDLAGYEGE